MISKFAVSLARFGVNEYAWDCKGPGFVTDQVVFFSTVINPVLKKFRPIICLLMLCRFSCHIFRLFYRLDKFRSNIYRLRPLIASLRPKNVRVCSGEKEDLTFFYKFLLDMKGFCSAFFGYVTAW